MSRAYKPTTYRRNATSGTAYKRVAVGRQQRRNAKYVSKRNQPNYQALRKNAGEKKGVDTSIALSDILITTNTNGSSVVLNLIQTGNGSWNRVGKQVYLKSIRLKGSADYRYAAQTTTNNLDFPALRMVVVWDKQPSGGTIPTWDSIFGITAQDGTESSTVWAPPKYDNMGRFKVLKDETMIPKGLLPIPLTITGAVNDISCPFDIYIKLGNKTTIFSGQSVPMTIADISTGALYLYCRTTFFDDAQAEWSLTAESVARLRYSD